jgi:threonine synthase
MDIQVASNFERLLYEVLGRDGGALGSMMSSLAATGEMTIPDAALAEMRQLFISARVSDEQTLSEIRRAYEDYGVFIDPHTAVGLHAAKDVLARTRAPHVVLATAHPAKFAGTVERATGKKPPIPAKLEGVMTASERYDRLPPDEGEIMSYVRARI